MSLATFVHPFEKLLCPAAAFGILVLAAPPAAWAQRSNFGPGIPIDGAVTIVESAQESGPGRLHPCGNDEWPVQPAF